jgi:hypothetical protein
MSCAPPIPALLAAQATGCRAPPPGQANSFAWRLHHIAVAVVEEIRRALPGVTVTCAHIWLLCPSDGVTHDGVWVVVAAAALAAMHSGRKNLIRLHLHQMELVGAGQTLITNYFTTVAGTPPPTVMQRATRWASVWFWCLLQDFVSIHSGVPRGWGAGPPAAPPFLVTDTTSPPARRIVVADITRHGRYNNYFLPFLAPSGLY